MWRYLFFAFFIANSVAVAEAEAEAGGGTSYSSNSVTSSSSSSCELPACGSTVVPYPFYYNNPISNVANGVPSQCPKRHFQLYCVNGEIYFPLNLPSSSRWPQYRVLTFNSNSIVIDPLLPNCSRPNVGAFTLIYQPHFSVSPGNYLQLYGCACSNDQGCLNITGGQLPGNLLLACAPLYGNPCCQLVNPNPAVPARRIQNFEAFKHCAVLTSWALKSSPGLSVNVEIGLRLDWALPGDCPGTCAPHAKCISNAALKGYTCQCRSGYTGDGFLNGTSCSQGSCDKGWTIDNQGNCVEVATRWAGMAALVSGILGGATVLAGILIACALLRLKKNRTVSMRRRRSGEQLVDLLPIGWGSGSSCCEVFSYKELERATKGFAAGNKLGNGACGVVYSGRLVDGRMVAVKRIHYWNTQGLQQVVNEANVLSTAKHQNLVRLFGCCFERGDPLLVFEYIANGTLAQHLQRERGQGLDWPTRLNVAASTADAIAYLHSFDPPIYHRDVKSSNILLDREFNAKVADFGLSRLVRDGGSHISTIPQGTPGYLDPEYHQNFHLSDKSDVYSFGVVLVEIISSLRAVDFSRDKKEINLAALAVAKISAGKVDDIIDPFLLEGKLDATALRASVHRLAELAFRCLAYDKDARPPMAEVAKEVGDIRGVISGRINPPNLNFSDSSNCSSSSNNTSLPPTATPTTVVTSPTRNTLQNL